MSVRIVGAGSSFPQTSANRSRDDVLGEIASFYGGEGRPTILNRAGKCWESAIREYNTWLWTFNRVTQDLTLLSPSPALSDTYDLQTDFAAPNRAKLVDSDGKERATVLWAPHEEWLTYCPDRSGTSTRPILYTAHNIHQTGKVIVYPRMAASGLQWPTLRIYYFRRILIPTAGSEKLNVPTEVDEGIFQLAQAKMTHKQKAFEDAAGEYSTARAYRIGLEHRFRDFPDIPTP